MINPVRSLFDSWKYFVQEAKNINDERKMEQWEEWENIKKSLTAMQRKESQWEQAKASKEKVENPGFILSFLRRIFGYLFLLSISKWLSQTHEKRKKIASKDLTPYRNVDIYVTVWFVFELVVVFIIYGYHSPAISKQLVLSCIFLGIFSYRLFDIFQSWVAQYVLRYERSAIHANRALVLAFIGYLEIAVIGTIIRMIFSHESALYNSVASLIANPQMVDSSPIQYVQILFSIMFLTVVAQQLIGRISKNEDEESKKP